MLISIPEFVFSLVCSWAYLGGLMLLPFGEEEMYRCSNVSIIFRLKKFKCDLGGSCVCTPPPLGGEKIVQWLFNVNNMVKFEHC